MIEYEFVEGRRGRFHVKVRLDGRLTGTIRIVDGGFRYFPLSGGKKTAGELFKTVREVQRSLEPDDEEEQRVTG